MLPVLSEGGIIWVKGGGTMAKTDKELTTEIVCSYIHAWGTQEKCIPVKHNELPSLIEDVYNAIVNLDKDHSSNE
jgi:predicted transcriptional regulator